MEAGHDGLDSGKLGGECIELFGHRRKSIERGAEKQDEDGLTVGQVVRLPVIKNPYLIWRET